MSEVPGIAACRPSFLWLQRGHPGPSAHDALAAKKRKNERASKTLSHMGELANQSNSSRQALTQVFLLHRFPSMHRRLSRTQRDHAIGLFFGLQDSLTYTRYTPSQKTTKKHGLNSNNPPLSPPSTRPTLETPLPREHHLPRRPRPLLLHIPIQRRQTPRPRKARTLRPPITWLPSPRLPPLNPRRRPPPLRR